MKRQVIKITESDLHNVINESVKKVLKESLNYSQADQVKELFTKAFSNLEPQEKEILYNALNENSWDCVYAALIVLKSKI